MLDQQLAMVLMLDQQLIGNAVRDEVGFKVGCAIGNKVGDKVGFDARKAVVHEVGDEG